MAIKTGLLKDQKDNRIYPQTSANVVFTQVGNETKNVQEVLNTLNANESTNETNISNLSRDFNTHRTETSNYGSRISTLETKINSTSKFAGSFNSISAMPNKGQEDGWTAKLIVVNGDDILCLWDVGSQEWVQVKRVELSGVSSVCEIQPDENGNVDLNATNINATVDDETKTIEEHLQDIKNDEVVKVNNVSAINKNITIDATNINASVDDEIKTIQEHLQSNANRIATLESEPTPQAGLQTYICTSAEDTPVGVEWVKETLVPGVIGNVSEVKREDDQNYSFKYLYLDKSIHNYYQQIQNGKTLKCFLYDVYKTDGDVFVLGNSTLQVNCDLVNNVTYGQILEILLSTNSGAYSIYNTQESPLWNENNNFVDISKAIKLLSEDRYGYDVTIKNIRPFALSGLYDFSNDIFLYYSNEVSNMNDIVLPTQDETIYEDIVGTLQPSATTKNKLYLVNKDIDTLNKSEEYLTVEKNNTYSWEKLGGDSTQNIEVIGGTEDEPLDLFEFSQEDEHLEKYYLLTDYFKCGNEQTKYCVSKRYDGYDKNYALVKFAKYNYNTTETTRFMYANNFYIYNNRLCPTNTQCFSQTYLFDYGLSCNYNFLYEKADGYSVIQKGSSEEYIPTTNGSPTNKKYVDDAINNAKPIKQFEDYSTNTDKENENKFGASTSYDDKGLVYYKKIGQSEQYVTAQLETNIPLLYIDKSILNRQFNGYPSTSLTSFLYGNTNGYWWGTTFYTDENEKLIRIEYPWGDIYNKSYGGWRVYDESGNESWEESSSGYYSALDYFKYFVGWTNVTYEKIKKVDDTFDFVADCFVEYKIVSEITPVKLMTEQDDVPSFKGDWTNTAYNKNDLVVYDGSSYICTQTHSARLNNPSVDTDYWSIFAAKGSGGGETSSGIQTLVGESSDPIILCNLDNGLYIIKGYVKFYSSGDLYNITSSRLNASTSEQIFASIRTEGGLLGPYAYNIFLYGAKITTDTVGFGVIKQIDPSYYLGSSYYNDTSYPTHLGIGTLITVNNDKNAIANNQVYYGVPENDTNGQVLTWQDKPIWANASSDSSSSSGGTTYTKIWEGNSYFSSVLTFNETGKDIMNRYDAFLMVCDTGDTLFGYRIGTETNSGNGLVEPYTTFNGFVKKSDESLYDVQIQYWGYESSTNASQNASWQIKNFYSILHKATSTYHTDSTSASTFRLNLPRIKYLYGIKF